MNTLLEPLSQMPEFGAIKDALAGGGTGIMACGCLDSQKAHLLFGLSEISSWRLVLAQDERTAKNLYEDFRFYDRETWLYPAKDLLFFQADVHGKVLMRQRMRVIKALLENRRGTVIASIDACLACLEDLQSIRNSLLSISRESVVEMAALRKVLVRLGYENVGQVEMPGEFSVRGGIIDIYALTEDNPWRIELFGDEVDSIRSFDSSSQRSLEELESITIYPAAENVVSDSRLILTDYFPPDSLIVLDEPNRLTEAGTGTMEEFFASCDHREEKGQKTVLRDQILTFEEVREKISKGKTISFSFLEPSGQGWNFTRSIWLNAKPVNHYKGSFLSLTKDLEEYKKKGYRVVLLSGSRTRAERLARDLGHEGFNAFWSADFDRDLKPGEIMIAYGHAHGGFEYPDVSFCLMADSDIFGKEQTKRKRKRDVNGQVIQSFHDLAVGDYVVHEQHGLGVYRGIENVLVDGVAKDYIKIEYKGGGELYVPATQLDSLQKYAGAGAAAPKLNTLGGTEWGKSKARVQKAVKNIAKELVELYAVRSRQEGYVCGPDTVWQREFEELFPYEETQDQLSAIEDTKRDMESPKIMDRLICGDVGYGKTEIALRAAFKEVQESRQVVYLVPTTILAQQHYNTFVERMKDFPVRIDLLCRFSTPKQQKKTLEDLKKGQVDVLIGTHRILSKDVEYKNLGLLIIDEEQRFGVTHKEKIKQLKKNVDVLTLTATPIPRTLHMSLIGIRDMSLLEEPPMDRVPIQTYVMEYDEETVREAIGREMRRGGQVYYVYNRVSNIGEIAAQIGALVPEARVGFAHGQMSERELEQVMIQFVNNELDVLVSTTIIETGLDISNVNTMIIHDADRFGLSQLYQLRGRIGRSDRTAYAFLMYKKDKMLKEKAEERLAAISLYSDLGSGFKIAMRDLEIRGAGDLLGAEQSGHMETVGYDLYCKMLNLAVKEVKEGKAPEGFDTTIDIILDAYIPDSYIRNEYQKLDAYKRIAGISTKQESDDMYDELLDRYGEPPRMVQNLLSIALIRAMAHHAYVTEIKQLDGSIRFSLYEKARLDRQGFVRLVEKNRHRLRYTTFKQKPTLIYTPSGNILTEIMGVVAALNKLAEA